jgi:hypothetical protein
MAESMDRDNIERLLSYAVDAKVPDWWDHPMKLKVVTLCTNAIWPVIQELNQEASVLYADVVEREVALGEQARQVESLRKLLVSERHRWNDIRRFAFTYEDHGLIAAMDAATAAYVERNR